MEKNEALARVRGIERDIHRLTYDLKETIVSAVLDGGATWPEIGNALAISKQTAHARYGLDVKIERDHRQWAIDNPERHAAAVARGQAAAAADLVEIEAAVAAKRASKISDADVAGTSETPSIFSDDTAPARAASIHGQRTVEVFQQFAADRAELKATATEDQERADYWEAKRKYVVTVDGAIYSPRGENGWDLHKVLRNVQGRNFQRSYSDTGELIAANEGLIYVSRDKYDGLVQNAAKDRECWIMAATERENTVSARPELMQEIKAMDEKLTAIQQQLKKNRNKKGPDYKTGG